MAMINPASLAFDIDGVVADTMTLFLDIARDVFGISGIQYEDMVCYNLAECIPMDPEQTADCVQAALEPGTPSFCGDRVLERIRRTDQLYGYCKR